MIHSSLGIFLSAWNFRSVSMVDGMSTAGPTGGFATLTCFASGGALMKWLCASMNAGSSALPSRSRTTVSGPLRFIASSFAPAKAMRPFSTTTAST